MKHELDRRRKYYLILDCETATLPHANSYSNDPTLKRNIAIAKPLIYDLGWQVVDKYGNVYKKKEFLISEIFSVPSIFNTAYYADKRPVYLDMLNGGAIDLVTWKQAIAELEHDMALVEGVGAYNAMFDFKKAIPFTDLYVNMLFSPDFQKWEAFQNWSCDQIARGHKQEGQSFEAEVFRFHDKVYPLFDVWGLTCEHIVNCPEYKQMCIDNQWETASGKYFPTNAEYTFRFASGNMDFAEAHTALADVVIETALFALCVQKLKGKFTPDGIEFFPFKKLGKVENFLLTNE